MKQLLEILAVLSLATASGTLGFVNQINQKNISDQQKDQTDIKDLFAGKLFLGSFLTPEEAKKNAENLLKVAKLSGKVKLGEPINGQIHVIATDESLTGEVNLTYHIIQDIQEILKNNLDLGYASSDSDAKIKAFYNLEKAKIRNRVILGEPSEGKIHVQADFPSLKGETDFEYKISQEIDKLLDKKTNLGPVNNDTDAQVAGQKAIDGLNLKDKVKLDEAMDGKIKVIPIHSSLRGYATFTYSIIPWLSSIITVTNLEILNNAEKGTILTRVEELNLEAKDKVEVESIDLDKKTAVIIAKDSKKYQGTVNVQFEVKKDRVPVIPPKDDIPVTLTKTTKNDPVLDPKDAEDVEKAVVEEMKKANVDRVWDEQTFEVDASKLAPTANEISVKVQATESTPEKPGLIAKDNLQVKLNLTTANLDLEPAHSAEISLDLKETTGEEKLRGDDIASVHDAIIEGMKKANKEDRVVDENTFTVDVNKVKNLTPESESVSVHVKSTLSTPDKAGLIEGDIEVSLDLKGIKMKIEASLKPDTISSGQTSTLHIEEHLRYKKLDLNYDLEKIKIDNFNNQGDAIIESLQNETENVVVPIEINADNAKEKITLNLTIESAQISIDADLADDKILDGGQTTLIITNYNLLKEVKVTSNEVSVGPVDINGKATITADKDKTGTAKITINANNAKESKTLTLNIISDPAYDISAILTNKNINGNNDEQPPKSKTEEETIVATLAANPLSEEKGLKKEHLEIKKFEPATKTSEGSALIVAKLDSKFTGEVNIVLSRLGTNEEQEVIDVLNNSAGLAPGHLFKQKILLNDLIAWFQDEKKDNEFYYKYLKSITDGKFTKDKFSVTNEFNVLDDETKIERPLTQEDINRNSTGRGKLRISFYYNYGGFLKQKMWTILDFENSK